MAEVGIIRPLLLKTLLNARNDVEYNDVKPPSVERCREFAEAVWYLLRSTDSILEVGHTEVAFRRDGESGDQPASWFCLEIEYKPKLKLLLRGKLAPDMIICERCPKALEIEVEYPANEMAETASLARNGCERPVMGELILVPEERKAVLRAVFGATSA